MRGGGLTVFFTWSKFTSGKERQPFTTVFRVPSVRDVALNVWKIWNLFTMLCLDSYLLGGRQVSSIDHLNLLSQHWPNPTLGEKPTEELLAGYPDIVPREDLSCAAMGQSAHLPSTQQNGKYSPSLKIQVCLYLVFSLQTPSRPTCLWATNHLGDCAFSQI